MFKKVFCGFLTIAAAMILAAGCGKRASSSGASLPQQKPPPGAYFQTHWQTECQFIVESIVSDLAEQMYYAARHRLPDEKNFSVVATETKGSLDAPNYHVVIDLDQQHTGLAMDLNINGPIWSPDVYRDVATTLATAVGQIAVGANGANDTSLITDLLDGSAETIEQDNQDLSGQLENNFIDPQLHEKAALLLGAFLLRDHSGRFFEIRSPLCRLTAHLAMAGFLNRGDDFGINGRMAEAIMLTEVDDEAQALDLLKSMDTRDAAVAAMVRALQALNTGDYRPLSDVPHRTQVESVAWFQAMADNKNADGAWNQLKDSQKQTVDFVRVAGDSGYSVSEGHQLMIAIPLELKEIGSIYERSCGKKLLLTELTNALNVMPERCFALGADGKAHVRVIGWGQWAAFLQRHFCRAIDQNYQFMFRMWGVPDDAKKFAAQCEKKFDGLRLYPFVRRFVCSDVASYHKSVDDAFRVTVAAPQLVPAECWNYLCYRTSFAPVYQPNPNPHINEWHNHNPPPGTVYDLDPRLNHPSLVSRPDVIARFEQLRQWAPYEIRIPYFIARKKYNGQPTYDQAMELFGGLLPWSVTAVRDMAGWITNQPEQYEKLLLQGAQLDSSFYYDLGYLASTRNQEDKAAEYYDKACENDSDAVRVSNYSEWRMRYYLKKGQVEKARAIADFGAQVYSSIGLCAEAGFMEGTSNYDGAFEWFSKNAERYNAPGPLVGFCERYKKATGDGRFDAELKKCENLIFPEGEEKVSLSDFRSPPTDGTIVKGESTLLAAAGMKDGDVIVALRGIRVHNFSQFAYLRDAQDSPELDMIVWQGNSFLELKSSPPNRRFGVSMVDYVAR